MYALIFAAVLISGERPGSAVEPALALPQEQTDAVLTFRPSRPEEHGETLTVEDLHIQDLVNQRALEIFTTASVRPEGEDAPTFGEVVIRNCEIGHLRRDETGSKAKLRVEGIRITGGGEEQPAATDVLIEDVYIHDGQGVPIRIGEGTFGTITFRRVRIEQILTPAVQVVLLNSGSVERIEIEDSPGLVVRLLGKPGSVGEVATSGSPDSLVVEEASPETAPGADTVADAAAERVEPVKLSVPPAAKAPKPMATRPAPAKPIELSASAEAGAVRISVANVPKDASHITFGVFDRFDYRIGTPVVVTEAPWEARIEVGKAGTYTVRIMLTRTGGDSDRPMETSVAVR